MIGERGRPKFAKYESRIYCGEDQEYQQLIERFGISAKHFDLLIGTPRFTNPPENEPLESCQDQASLDPLDWTILQEEPVRLRPTGEL